MRLHERISQLRLKTFVLILAMAAASLTVLIAYAAGALPGVFVFNEVRHYAILTSDWVCPTRHSNGSRDIPDIAIIDLNIEGCFDGNRTNPDCIAKMICAAGRERAAAVFVDIILSASGGGGKPADPAEPLAHAIKNAKIPVFLIAMPRKPKDGSGVFLPIPTAYDHLEAEQLYRATVYQTGAKNRSDRIHEAYRTSDGGYMPSFAYAAARLFADAGDPIVVDFQDRLLPGHSIPIPPTPKVGPVFEKPPGPIVSATYDQVRTGDYGEALAGRIWLLGRLQGEHSDVHVTGSGDQVGGIELQARAILHAGNMRASRLSSSVLRVIIIGIALVFLALILASTKLPKHFVVGAGLILGVGPIVAATVAFMLRAFGFECWVAADLVGEAAALAIAMYLVSSIARLTIEFAQYALRKVGWLALFGPLLLALPSEAAESDRRVILEIIPPDAVVQIDDRGISRFQAVVGDELAPTERLILTGDVEVVMTRGGGSVRVTAEDAAEKAGPVHEGLASWLVSRVVWATRLSHVPGATQSEECRALPPLRTFDVALASGANEQFVAPGARALRIPFYAPAGLPVDVSFVSPNGRVLATSTQTGRVFETGPIDLAPGLHELRLGHQGEVRHVLRLRVAPLPRPPESLNALGDAAADYRVAWLAARPEGAFRLEAHQQGLAARPLTPDRVALLRALEAGYRLDDVADLGPCFRR